MQVELGVQRVAQEQLDDDLLGLDLRGEPAQPGFVLVGRRADRELVAELFGELSLRGDGAV